MPKVQLTDLSSLANETTAIAAINANNAAVEAGFNNTISRDGTSPNTLEADIDLNNFRIYNVMQVPSSDSDVATKYYVDYVTGNSSDSVPTNPHDAYFSGDVTVVGDLTVSGSVVGYLQNVVEDTTPQLGGNLDLNGHVITGLEIGTDVQAYDADLTALAALTKTDSNFIVGNGSTWITESGATARTSLGLGSSSSPQFTAIEVGHASDTTLARASAGDLSVEGNILYRAGGTDVPITDGGTGASDASTARTNLGLAIGTDVQAYDAGLADIAGLALTDSNFIVGDGVNWVAESGATARTSLGLGSGDSPSFTAVTVGSSGLTVGVSVPFSDTAGFLTLQSVDFLDATTETTIESSIDTLVNLTSIQGQSFTMGAYAPTLLNTADEAGFKTAVNLEIGTDVQAYDAELAALAGLTSAADTLPYFTGSGTASTTSLTSTARTLLDDSSTSSMRTTLGLAIGTDVQAYDADTLKADTADVLTAGFAHTPDNDGTQSSGTYTPDESGGNMKYIVNGGAFTLAPPTNNCCIIVQITNNASAGAITTSGFSATFGDSFTTTNGDDFICTIIKINGFSSLTVQDVS